MIRLDDRNAIHRFEYDDLYYEGQYLHVTGKYDKRENFLEIDFYEPVTDEDGEPISEWELQGYLLEVVQDDLSQ